MGHRLTRIYTRTGDDGTTGLIGGQRVRKSDGRIDCVGAVDDRERVVDLRAQRDPSGVRREPREELRAAARAIGLDEVTMLEGYADGGVADRPFEQLVLADQQPERDPDHHRQPVTDHQRLVALIQSGRRRAVAHEGDHYRTRLTHTLEVSQIARSIAKVLRLHEELTEAITLVPDGHVSDEDYNAAAAVLTADQIAAVAWLATVMNAFNRAGAVLRAAMFLLALGLHVGEARSGPQMYEPLSASARHALQKAVSDQAVDGNSSIEHNDLVLTLRTASAKRSCWTASAARAASPRRRAPFSPDRCRASRRRRSRRGARPRPPARRWRSPARGTAP